MKIFKGPETLESFEDRQKCHAFLRLLGGWVFSLFAVFCILGFTPLRLPWHLHLSRQLWATVVWALFPPVVFWLEYFWFAPNLAKIAKKQTEDARRAAEEAVGRLLPNATEMERASVLQAAETVGQRNMEFANYKLDRLNDFRGVSVPIWAAVGKAYEGTDRFAESFPLVHCPINNIAFAVVGSVF